MVDSDGSVHLETNGQTFIYLLQSLWTFTSDSRHLLANVLRLWRQNSFSSYLSSFCRDLATLALIFFLLASQETYSMTSSLTSQLSFALLINDN
jgi:putative flippase GtrA